EAKYGSDPMLKILCTVCALVAATSVPMAAAGQENDHVRVGYARVGGVPLADVRYYGGTYRDWRNSHTSYWGWAVAGGLLATAPTYYYGVGFGNGFGYEVPLYDDAAAYCMRRFRSYDRVTGTYLGRGGYRYPCP